MQAGKEGKVVGVELRQYALDLSRDAMTKMHKNKECAARRKHVCAMQLPVLRKLLCGFVRNLNSACCAAFCARPLRLSLIHI